MANSVFGQSPSIQQGPVSQTIFFGDPVTFSVNASGGSVLQYQWLKNGTPISSATDVTYTRMAVGTGDQGADFSVIVSNVSGSVTSAVARLTVDPGIAGPAVTNQLFTFSNIWTYNQTQNLDSADWANTNFDDVSWVSGPGLLAYDNNSLITPLIGTTLTSPQSPAAGVGNGHAYYFRTRVNITNDLLPDTLLGTIRCDDGAVIYINGSEAKRVRMPSGAITNLSFATGFAPDSQGGSDATVDESIEFPGLGLSRGTNVIAVSVHQANSGSSDVVWGMALAQVGRLRVRDTNPPVVAQLIPAPQAVPSFSELEVHFSKGVKGVDANDLLINGIPAASVTAYGSDVYVFNFAQPPLGLIQVSWNPGHGVLDLTANSNSFAGGNYSYTLDPTAIASAVQITEFMAANAKTIRDEDGHYSDWIELYNSGQDPVDLARWSLTDTLSNLRKWQFPVGVVMPSRSYLLVWASGNNRTNPAAPLHTNFKLDKAAGNFLGLVYSDGQTVVSSFSTYPKQFDDVSYGRDRLDSSLFGYFTNATPGAANATLGAGFEPEVVFSLPSGTFRQAFSLSLSTPDPTAVIRYFLVTNGTTAAMTNVPNSSSPVYTGPLSITGSAQVRARAFPTKAGYFPGPPHSETYLQLDSNVAQFSSDLPIVVFHTMGGGAVAETADQFMTMQVFDTQNGRSSPTRAPDQAAQGIFHRRGQATFWNPKPNLRVETRDEFGDDLDVPLAGFPADSDWVFYGINQYDKVLMHNRLSHQLYRDMGHYSSRTRFIEVYINTGSGTAGPITSSDYCGLYVLEEKIKLSNDRVDGAKLAPENTNAPSVTGSYLLSIDKTKAGDPPQFYAANASMTYVDPDYYQISSTPAQQQYLNNYFNSFYTALNDANNWTNPVTGYAAYIDLDSWIDYHLHQTLLFNVDALRISSYFYKPRGGKIVQGPLWDFDRCFATRTGDDARAFNPRRWRSADMDGGTDMFNAGNTFNNPWYGKLFTDPDFWQRWIDRYQELRRDLYSVTNLNARIDQFGNEVREATAREYVRWAGGGSSDTTPRSGSVSGDGLTYVFPNPGTWQGEINFTKWWFSNRVDFMDSNFLKPPVFNAAPGPVVRGSHLILTSGTVEPNSTIYYTLDGTDPRLPGGAVSPAALSSLNSATLTLNSNVRVFARNWNGAHQNLTGANNPPLSSSWSGPMVGTFYTDVPSLRITEVMYHPAPPPSGNTNDADNFEFVEFKNIGSTSLNLQGFRLHGGIDFVFPSLVIAAGQEVVVVKNLAAFQSRYGTGVLVAGVYTNKLANTGDHLVLEGPVKEPILDFNYKDAWYPVTDGLGFSLVIRDPNAATDSWNLKESWRPSSSLNGSPGQVDPAPTAIPGIVINEALVHTDPPLEDTIELLNPTVAPVDIGGWLLTDDRHTPIKYRIPDGTIVGAGSYITITSNQFSVGPRAFSLSSIGEEVLLFSADAGTNLTGYAHGFQFGASPHEVGFTRYVNSQGEEQFVLESQNTLGDANAYPRMGPVVISEIMYHPPDLAGGVDDYLDEFIEVQNITATNVPLYDPNATTNTYRLRHAVDFDFPSNVVLAPGAKLLVVGFNPALYVTQLNAFKAKYNVPPGVSILGPWSGKLNNAGERVELHCPDIPNVTPTNIYVPYYLVEAVDYRPTAPWPTEAEGLGNSLQRIQPGLFGNDPLNWRALPPTAGQSPSSPTVDISPADQTVAMGTTAVFSVVASGAAPLNYQWHYNGADIAGATLSTFSIPNAQTLNEGNYSVTVSNPAGNADSRSARLTVLSPPAITGQPFGPQTLTLGAQLNLTVQASGSAPLSYQWRLNGRTLVSQTRMNFSILSVQATDAGDYSVVVTNDVGAVTSAVATVTVLMPPSLTIQPVSQSVLVGSSVSFTVVATGSGSLSYQWQWNGSALRGATESSYTVPDAQVSDAGNYSVSVTNLGGSVLSSNAVLTVFVPPSIATQPLEQSVVAGSNVTFSVTALGSAPLNYQWQRNGVGIPGATMSSYTLSNVQSSDAANYTVVVTNRVGSIVSANAGLTVLVPPAITAQPPSQSVVLGSNATFTVSATGTAPLSYQWQKDGVGIAGATLNSYTLAAVQSNDAGNYSVVITNQAGGLNSATAALTILVPPGIETQPGNVSVPLGSNATFSVTATGSAPLGYQWYFETNTLPGETNFELSLPRARELDAGQYFVVVTNSAGSATSTLAVLSVLIPPSITLQPSNQALLGGAQLTMVVEASGTPPFSYQWEFNGTPIPGATSSRYFLAGFQANNAGVYRVVVSNVVASTLSQPATIRFTAPTCIISEFTRSASNSTFTVSSVVGLTYVLEFTGSLGEQTWTPQLPAVPGNGSSLSFSDTNPPATTSRFYRIRAW